MFTTYYMSEITTKPKWYFVTSKRNCTIFLNVKHAFTKLTQLFIKYAIHDII